MAAVRRSRSGEATLPPQLIEELGSSYTDRLHRLMQVGINLADGSSVYLNLPKRLGRARQLVISPLRVDCAPRWNTTDSDLMLELELIQRLVATPAEKLRLG